MSRRRLDVCPVDDAGELVEHLSAPPDADGLRGLVARVGDGSVRAVIESMTGARFIHVTLEQFGWEVLVTDAQKVKGLAPPACRTDSIDARVSQSGLGGRWSRRPGRPTRASVASASLPDLDCISSGIARR